jgi:hypothetical protein
MPLAALALQPDTATIEPTTSPVVLARRYGPVAHTEGVQETRSNELMKIAAANGGGVRSQIVAHALRQEVGPLSSPFRFYIFA